MKTSITTASDRGYLPAACCQLKSVVDHLPPGCDVELNLVCCDVDEAELEAARKFFAARQMMVRIFASKEVEQAIRPINTRWPRAAYLRLYFDRIFGSDIERLIYFDADTRIMTSLAPLLSLDLKGRIAGAVHDFVYYLTGNIRRRRKDLFLADDAPYLQSGVMVFDWPRMLSEGVLDRARQFLVDHPESCQEAPDQDALNFALEGQWLPLDPRWNLHETYLEFGGALTPNLEHYTSTKPWSKRRPARWQDAARWYRSELADTVWADFIPEQSSVDRLNARIDFLKFRYNPKIRDALAVHAPFVLDALHVPRQRTDEEELPWAPRNSKDVEDMAMALVAEARGERGEIRPPEAVLDGYGSGSPIGLNGFHARPNTPSPSGAAYSR
ncbi:glycosyltransferase family 8 protein [Novosphingobium pentaromativorans]|uniref:glycosyltransferase family 8 protein n=1 Tax=Novosphingobium pentaromativorans TaxID=205844 RepID=UPI00051F7E5A|nr:glycosyltransferase family 8 protein [Novosphingobium pentaromativorans]AIT79485.1 galactosyltransferase [Novosphingobium pentaromativorans US6-1]